jgi:hypothetical protein
MAKARPSVQKRNLEAKKLERAQAKAARKAARERAAAARAEASADTEGDPDLAGIVAGPQHTPGPSGGEEMTLDEIMASL